LDGKPELIKERFEECGEVKDIEMMKKSNGAFIGTVKIEFANTDAADKALELNDEQFFNRKMKISYFKEGESYGTLGTDKPNNCKTIFIGNLAYDVSEEEVYNFFF